MFRNCWVVTTRRNINFLHLCGRYDSFLAWLLLNMSLIVLYYLSSSVLVLGFHPFIHCVYLFYFSDFELFLKETNYAYFQVNILSQNRFTCFSAQKTL